MRADREGIGVTDISRGADAKPTVAEKFNTYRFAGHKEAVVALLARVCTVSGETMKIVRAMP